MDINTFLEDINELCHTINGECDICPLQKYDVCSLIPQALQEAAQALEEWKTYQFITWNQWLHELYHYYIGFNSQNVTFMDWLNQPIPNDALEKFNIKENHD